MNSQIHRILPNGISFGVSYIVVFGIILFFSIDVKCFSLLMIAYQGFTIYNFYKKDYNAGSFIDGASYTATIIILFANMLIQNTFRNFLVINIQIENLY